MFDTLSSKLQNAFKNLRGLGKISESNVSDSLREVRLALLDADVNFKVVRDFIERVRAKSLGQEVIQSIQPGQQIIKIIHDEMVDLLGSANAGLELTGNPTSILLVGLHGSGKTTSSAKLARLLQKQGRTINIDRNEQRRPSGPQSGRSRSARWYALRLADRRVATRRREAPLAHPARASGGVAHGRSARERARRRGSTASPGTELRARPSGEARDW